MKVYYLTSSQFALSNIALRRIKVSRFSELNDPFELLALDLGNKDLRIGIKAKKTQINKNEGLLCFSETWTDLLMWGHYGDKHQGVCLGFEIPDHLLVKVDYVTGLEKVKVNSDTPQKDIELMLSQLKSKKFHGWKYEKEHRQFLSLKKLHKESNFYFLPFSDSLVLSEVILGARCQLTIKGLKELLSAYKTKVYLKKARIAYTKFKVVEDKSYREEIQLS